MGLDSTVTRLQDELLSAKQDMKDLKDKVKKKQFSLSGLRNAHEFASMR